MNPAIALAMLSAGVRALRAPGSPYPVPALGLNSTLALRGFDLAVGTVDDAFSVLTLQGVLSKRSPAIYRYSAQSEYAFWLNETTALYGTHIFSSQDFPSLLSEYGSQLDGYILCDLNDNSTNTAIAAAAALDVVAVTTNNVAVAQAAGLAQVFDLRGKDLAWAIQTFNGTPLVKGFTYRQNVTVLQLASKSQTMGDFSIAGGILQWWRDDISDGLSSSIWQSLEDASVATGTPFVMLGWGPDEIGTVGTVSKAGGAVVASDWASNLDVLSSFDIPAFTQKKAAASLLAAPDAVHTVTFLMSDGDNVQWLLDSFATDPHWYGSPDRGNVSMGWTLSPSLADLAPVVMNYLYSHASDGSAPGRPGRDVFVSGVSGAGYFYPDLIDPASGPASASALAHLAALTASYMAKADMRIVNVLGHGEGYDAATVHAYTAQDQVDAVIWYNYNNYAGMKGNISWVDGKPIIGGRFNLWGTGMAPDPTGPNFCNVTSLVTNLLQQVRDPTTSAGYSLVPVHAWSHNVTDTVTVHAMLEAAAPGAVEIVSPDVFVARILANIQH